MQLTTLLTSLALATTTLAFPLEASTAETPTKGPGIYLRNACPFNLYTFNTSTATTGTLLAPSTKPPKSGDLYPYYNAYSGFASQTGNVIKIKTKDESIYANSPTLHVSWSINEESGLIYYDVSSSQGVDAELKGRKVAVRGDTGKGAPTISWVGGDGPSGTKAYFGETSLWVTICA